MSNELGQILEDAAGWLERQDAPLSGTAEWFALRHFRNFLASVSEKSAPPALEQACHVIRHWIVDQFEWDAPYSKVISGYVERVSRVAKEEAWRSHRQNNG